MENRTVAWKAKRVRGRSNLCISRIIEVPKIGVAELDSVQGQFKVSSAERLF